MRADDLVGQVLEPARIEPACHRCTARRPRSSRPAVEAQGQQHVEAARLDVARGRGRAGARSRGSRHLGVRDGGGVAEGGRRPRAPCRGRHERRQAARQADQRRRWRARSRISARSSAGPVEARPQQPEDVGVGGDGDRPGPDDGIERAARRDGEPVGDLARSPGRPRCPPTRLTMAVETTHVEAAYPLPQGPSTRGGIRIRFGDGPARPTSQQRAEEGAGLGARRAARAPRRAAARRGVPEAGAQGRAGSGPTRLDVLLDHAGGSVPPAELLEPIDELEERYGLPRVALTMLRVGMPVAARVGRDRPVRGQRRSGAGPGRRPMPTASSAGRPLSASPETLLKERDRIAEDLRARARPDARQGPQAARGARGARRHPLAS